MISPKTFTILFILVFLGIPVVDAAEVILSTPQSEYFAVTGDPAVIPVSIASTYGHDVTGMLESSMMPVNPGNDSAGSPAARVQQEEFSAFTDNRTVSLPVGTSDTPADYLLTIRFRYEENGERSASLGGIRIHFVSEVEGTPANQEVLTSTDAPAAASGSEGSSSAGPGPAGSTKAVSPDAKVQNSQMQEDTRAILTQMTDEANRSENERDELLGYAEADPLVRSLSQPLEASGFTRGNTAVTPISNRSGTFQLMYTSGTQNAVIEGSIADSHARFAEESSAASVPLPGPLLANTSFQNYKTGITGRGFTRNETRINVTPGQETVGLSWSDPQNRILHVDAVIVNGSVVSINEDNPDNPLASSVPYAGLAGILLLSGGIWYFARSRKEDIPVSGIPSGDFAPSKTTRAMALQLLEEAELDGAGGAFPEAYRKIGRAVRISLAHKTGSGDEMTTGELEHRISFLTGDSGNIRRLLDRCISVGFAKDIPELAEFQEMIRHARKLVEDYLDDREAPGP